MYNLYMYLSTLLILGFILGIPLRRKGFSSSISYLLAGIITSLIFGIPEDVKVFLTGIGELAIILLFFEIGYEIRIDRIKELMGFPLYLTLVECLLAMIASLGIGMLFGLSFWATIVLGIIASFSSTVFTFKLLEDIRPSRDHVKNLVYMVVIIEDVILVIFLGFLETMGVTNIYQYIAPLTIPLVMFTLSYEFTRHILKRYLGRDENSVVLVIGYSLALGFLSTLLGSSPAIGAFIAGLTLSGVDAGLVERIRPIRSFTLILFFATLGTSISGYGLTSESVLTAILLAIAIVVVHLMASLSASMLMSGQGILYGLETGIYLSTLSELGLIIVYVALRKNLIPHEVALASSFSIIIATIVSSMIASRKAIVLVKLYRLIPRGFRETLGFLSTYMNMTFTSLKYHVMLNLLKNLLHVMGEIIILSIILTIVVEWLIQYMGVSYIAIAVPATIYVFLYYIILKRSIKSVDKIVDMVKARNKELLKKETRRLLYSLNTILAVTTITATIIIMNYEKIHQYLGITITYILGLTLALIPLIIITILSIIEK